MVSNERRRLHPPSAVRIHCRIMIDELKAFDTVFDSDNKIYGNIQGVLMENNWRTLARIERLNSHVSRINSNIDMIKTEIWPIWQGILDDHTRTRAVKRRRHMEESPDIAEPRSKHAMQKPAWKLRQPRRTSNSDPACQSFRWRSGIKWCYYWEGMVLASWRYLDRVFWLYFSVCLVFWSPQNNILNTNLILPSVNALCTWRDLFVEEVNEMPGTRLVMHCIPTCPRAILKAAKLPLYTEEEITWQYRNIPAMEEARIISPCISPWCTKTKFPQKHSGVLRMVHQYIPINSTIIKMNYLMRCIEPILNQLSDKKWKIFSKADAANRYWAVSLALEHTYKISFVTVLGQYCYLQMGQELTRAPGTYSWLKDITMGEIPAPFPEPALINIVAHTHCDDTKCEKDGKLIKAVFAFAIYAVTRLLWVYQRQVSNI